MNLSSVLFGSGGFLAASREGSHPESLLVLGKREAWA